MEIRTLHAFVEVVRQGGFSKAARTLFATQPTVSKAVRQLEDELGLPLLDRTGHRCTLTAAGEIVFRRAVAMLTERDDLVAELDELKGLRRGVLRLGLPPIGTSTLFASVFAQFRARYPGVAIQFVEHGSKHLEDLVLSGELELGASLLPLPEKFDWQAVRREPIDALVHAGHPLARKSSARLTEFRDIGFILFGPGFALNPMILEACHRQGFTPEVAVRTSQLDFLIELVAAKTGVAFLPRIIAEQRRTADIRRIPIAEGLGDWHLALIWRRGGYLSPAARAWLALSADTLAGLAL
ncbi:LysR substrate-binding domain-containing protein [Megalodesulfovibrio paquesii]